MKSFDEIFHDELEKIKDGKIVKISEIKVPEYYGSPAPKKMKECRNYYKLYNKLDRDIIVDNQNMIVDGYVGYLIAKEFGMTDVPVVKLHPSYRDISTKYVYGKHIGGTNDKEYVWRVANRFMDEDISIGDTVYVNSNRKVRPVEVTKVEILDTPPVEGCIKKVVFFNKTKLSIDNME